VGDAVAGHRGVAADELEALVAGLGNEQAVEGIAMVIRQGATARGMVMGRGRKRLAVMAAWRSSGASSLPRARLIVISVVDRGLAERVDADAALIEPVRDRRVIGVA
jgi:hypothetical protein